MLYPLVPYLPSPLSLCSNPCNCSVPCFSVSPAVPMPCLLSCLLFSVSCSLQEIANLTHNHIVSRDKIASVFLEIFGSSLQVPYYDAEILFQEFYSILLIMNSLHSIFHAIIIFKTSHIHRKEWLENKHECNHRKIPLR